MNKGNNIMKVKDIKKYLYNQVPLRILSFLSLHSKDFFSAKEISESAKSSKGATHQTLQILLGLDIIRKEQKGNLFIYRINNRNSLLRQFKIFETMTTLQPLINKIKPYCYKIVLFGSCAQGTNTDKSDIDLFVKTDDREIIQKHINKYILNGINVKAAIFEPLEITSSKKEDKIFFEEVKMGIVLWEGKPEHETI